MKISDQIPLDFKRTLSVPPFQVLVEIMQNSLYRDNPSNMKVLINFQTELFRKLTEVSDRLTFLKLETLDILTNIL